MSLKKHHSLVILILIFSTACNYTAANSEKLIIGAVADVDVLEAGITFIARVDTGAAVSSIHAKDLSVSNDQIDYSIINASGKTARLSSAIVKQAFVNNAETREKRYYVTLTVSHQGAAKKILVNLNDRSASSYKLLLGRNWLAGDYLVDVDK